MTATSTTGAQGQEGREARAELRRLLVGMDVRATDKTVQDILDILPHMLDMAGEGYGLLECKYTDGVIVKVRKEVDILVKKREAA